MLHFSHSVFCQLKPPKKAEMKTSEDGGGKRAYKLGAKFWTVLRKVISSILTLGALGLIMYAIGKGYAALPGHWAVHYSLFLFVIVLLGYLEGLQIAILEMEHSRLPSDATFQKTFRRGVATLQLSTANGGNNVKRFLIGRQFFVVFVVFLCAQLTTFPTLPKSGWPEWLFIGVIDTGLPGALVVLAFGQLMPQLIAATHPLRFMNLVFSWSVVKLALILESIGIAHCSWVLASAVKWSLGWKKNETIDSNLYTHTKDGDDHQEKMDGNGSYNSPLSVSSEEAVDVAMFQAAKLGCEEVSESAQQGDSDKDLFLPPWISQRGDEESMYKDWGYNALSGTPFPGPKQIVDYLVSKKKRVPRYLLPPTHLKHIPPHVVAYDLLKNEEKLNQKCIELERKVQELQDSLENSQAELQDHASIDEIV